MHPGPIGQYIERQVQQERGVRLSRVHAAPSGINSATARINDRRPLFDEICRIAVDDGKFGLA